MSRGFEWSRFFGIGSSRKGQERELNRAKKTSCEIWFGSETVVNPLSGYD
jgi:hypothetical protein